MGVCLKLTDAELYELVSAGATVTSGPHADEATCIAACGTTGGGAVCGGYVIPNDLCLVITGDPCACTLPVAMALTWSPADEVWLTKPIECNGDILYFIMVCFGGLPYFFEVCGGRYRRGNTGTVSYSPFSFSGNAIPGLGDFGLGGGSPCCPSGGDMFFSITEGPCAGAPTPSAISRAVLSGTLGPIGYPNMASVTVAAGAMLIVVVGISGTGTLTATYDGNAMTVTTETDGAGHIVAVCSYLVASLTTGNIVIAGVAGRGVSFAFEVTGLTNNLVDVSASDSGTGADPETGATATTAIADEYVQSAFIIDDPTVFPVVWTNDFVTGEQNVLPAGIRLVEGYRILSATGTPNGKLIGTSVTSFAGITKAFK